MNHMNHMNHMTPKTPRTMIRFLLPLVVVVGASVAAGQDQSPPSPIAMEGKRQTEDAGTPVWKPIFNGRDLDGWVYKETGSELGVDPSSTPKTGPHGGARGTLRRSRGSRRARRLAPVGQVAVRRVQS